MCMDPRHFFLLFFVTIAPLPAMTQFSLRFRQFFLAVSEIVRITCMFSIGIYIEFFHGKVESDGLPCVPYFHWLFFTKIQKRNIIPPISFHTDGCAFQAGIFPDLTMLPDPDPACLWELQLPIF